MRKLTLQFEGRTLREFVVDQGATIGRLPDNQIVIDNPAVSGHHARLVCDGDGAVLEDLDSTNGTFVNGRPVTRHAMQSGDSVLVGKHTLVYEQLAAAPVLAATALPALGDTVYLDTEQHRALVAQLHGRPVRASGSAGPPRDGHDDGPPQAGGGEHSSQGSGAARDRSARIGMLRVVDGHAERAEYDLEGQTSLIGRSDTAVVRLRGWFKPSVAVAIARNGEEYTATLLGGKTLVNGHPLKGRHRLKEGDILHVSGLTLEFSMRNGRDWMSAGARAATARELT
jgi:pSer/pThr/pTyr-binding forkhead associated (FHA) protein